jgi:hypothetical protein
MWCWPSDNTNRDDRCPCLELLSVQDRAEPYECNACVRRWTWIACDWWSNYKRHAKKAPLLAAPDGWHVRLCEVLFQGRPIRKYLATHDNGAAVLLDSISNVLDALGKGDPLIHWSVMEACLAIAGPWLGNYDARPHMKTENADGKKVTQKSFARVVQALPPLVQGKPLKIALADLVPVFDAAAVARRKTANLAAEYGTRAHELIDLWKRRGGTWEYEEGGVRYMTDISKEETPVFNCLQAFLRFWAREKLQFIESEITVYDVAAGIAGTLDALVRTESGDLVCLDWKTSGGVYEKFFLQVCAYTRMHEKMGLGRVSRAYIIRMGKELAELQIVPVFLDEHEYQEGCRDFGALLRLDRSFKRINARIRAFPPEAPPAPPGQAPDPDFAAIIAEGAEAMANV